MIITAVVDVDGVADSTLSSMDASGSELNLGWLAVKMFFTLMLIIGLIVGSIFLLRRYFGRQLQTSSGHDWLEVVARVSIQPRQTIVLAKAFDRYLLIGVTENQMSTLAEFREELEVRQISAALNQAGELEEKNRFLGVLMKQFSS